MPRFQQNIRRYARNQENVNHTQGQKAENKKKIAFEKDQMMNLADEDFNY